MIFPRRAAFPGLRRGIFLAQDIFPDPLCSLFIHNYPV